VRAQAGKNVGKNKAPRGSTDSLVKARGGRVIAGTKFWARQR